MTQNGMQQTSTKLKTIEFIQANNHMVRVFEKRMLGKIFGPKSDKVTRNRRKVHNEELNDLYSSSNIADQIKKNELDRQVAHIRERRGAWGVM